ncbi:hypothetical protein HUT17_05025 (plasmid) [Nocardiopsis flavescens]|nr:hypothetical protein HUT17_05025 [Nocardiopsis flavescens]
MSTTHLALATGALLLGGLGCATEEPIPEPDPAGPTAPAEEEFYEEPAEQQALTAELGETVDFGDGVTLAMVDLRREIAEDGFNSITGEEGDLPYVAWQWELTNGTDAPLEIGGETSSCFVGDPLQESEKPVLGESVNPPEMLAPDQTGSWDVDCWMDEQDTDLQYTLELYDPESVLMYTVTFAGQVPQD